MQEDFFKKKKSKVRNKLYLLVHTLGLSPYNFIILFKKQTIAKVFELLASTVTVSLCKIKKKFNLEDYTHVLLLSEKKHFQKKCTHNLVVILNAGFRLYKGLRVRSSEKLSLEFG